MKIFHLSYAEGIRQIASNKTYSTYTEISCLDALIQAVKFDHVAGLFKNNERGISNFINADCVIMDCDNDHSDNLHDWLILEKLSERIPNVPFFIVYSRNHMKDKYDKDGNISKSARPRFHVYFILSKTYTDDKEIRVMKEKILRIIPEFDAGAKDAARFIYGVEYPQADFHEGNSYIDVFLDSVPLNDVQGNISIAEEVNDNSDSIAASVTNFTRNDEDVVITLGERNTTLFHVAMQALGKVALGMCKFEQAKQIFDNACAKCKPPLSISEVNQIWNQATTYAKDFKDKRDNSHEILMTMRDDFLEGKHIFFHGTIKGGSFYEYQPAGYWARLTDASMQSEISKHFRHSKSNKVFYELTTMVRLMHTEHSLPKFNQKRLWAFKNGVLDLDTGELRQPKPDDFLTWQVEYGYDAEATCPLFDKFLAECANNEPSRINFLDDMLGYIPYEDNRLEKIFVLVGEGMNGKGTLLNVIENLVRNVHANSNGFQSYTNVPLSEFSKPTQLIMLDGSIVNLSYDLNENLRGCESALKSVSSGDTVNGNRKFCDSESFTPRCKLICASNHMLKLSDDSFGMRRRLMFCRFANCFKGRENVNLKKQLISELPGIFNKMYRAYKALLERENELGSSAIRTCIDNDELMNEFNQTANPVAAFWNEFKNEYLSRGELPKAKIFDDFKAFCERNGKFAGTESNFHKNLKRVATDEGITIKDTRHRENGMQPVYCLFNRVNAPETTVTETTAQKNITLDDVLNNIDDVELEA